MLGPILFSIYMNDLPVDCGIINWILKFADAMINVWTC